VSGSSLQGCSPHSREPFLIAWSLHPEWTGLLARAFNGDIHTAFPYGRLLLARAALEALRELRDVRTDLHRLNVLYLHLGDLLGGCVRDLACPLGNVIMKTVSVHYPDQASAAARAIFVDDLRIAVLNLQCCAAPRAWGSPGSRGRIHQLAPSFILYGCGCRYQVMPRMQAPQGRARAC
jgi:hypothetical protein